MAPIVKERAIRVLCVDDDEDSLRLMAHQLGELFSVATVGDAQAALDRLASEDIDVVVTDHAMPAMSGAALLHAARDRRPELIGILLTAVDDIDLAVAALNDGSVFRFLRKPWAAPELVAAVREAIARRDLAREERLLRAQLARANAELDERVQDLDEANQLLEYWVEYSPAVLYSFTCDDGNLRASYIGRNFLRLSGYERTTAVIEPGFWPGLMNATDRNRYETMVESLRRGERLLAVIEYDIRHRDGNTVAILDSMRAVHDGDGRTLEIMGAWLDVSARE